MKDREARLPHVVLVKALDYNTTTGVFTWRTPASNRVKVGDVAGGLDKNGHRSIQVNGTRYFAHRLAWFYVNGIWPGDEIDHRDLVKDHNWIDNLREASRAGNCRNVGRKRHNKLGVKGVCRQPNARHRFRAQITVDGITRYLGLFGSAEEAHAAYVAASSIHHGEFGRAD